MSTVLDAAYNVLHDYPGGSLSLGPRIGKNGHTLSHEVVQRGTAKLGLVDAVKMSVVSNDRRILNAFAAEMGCMVLMLPKIDRSVNTFTELGALAREFGEYVEKLSEALSDGKVTDNELARVREELAELIVAAQSLEASASRMNAEQHPLDK
jgi:hypothetical protein